MLIQCETTLNKVQIAAMLLRDHAEESDRAGYLSDRLCEHVEELSASFHAAWEGLVRRKGTVPLAGER